MAQSETRQNNEVARRSVCAILALHPFDEQLTGWRTFRPQRPVCSNFANDRSWPAPALAILAQSWRATIVSRVAGMLLATLPPEIPRNSPQSDRQNTTAQGE